MEKSSKVPNPLKDYLEVMNLSLCWINQDLVLNNIVTSNFKMLTVRLIWSLQEEILIQHALPRRLLREDTHSEISMTLNIRIVRQVCQRVKDLLQLNIQFGVKKQVTQTFNLLLWHNEKTTLFCYPKRYLRFILSLIGIKHTIVKLEWEIWVDQQLETSYKSMAMINSKKSYNHLDNQALR